MLTRWSQYGDIQQMEYAELVSMKASSRAFLFDPRIVIDDEELTRYSKNWHKPAVSKDLERYDAESEDEKVKEFV